MQIATTSNSRKINENPASTPKVPSKKQVIPVVVTESISLQDQNEIASTVQTFITAVHTKDAEKANSLVSSESKAYFNRILNSSRTASKNELLSQDFSIAMAVVLTRIVAASTTLQIQGKDIITRMVTLGSSTWLDSVDFTESIVATKPLRPNLVDVIITVEGKEISTLHVIKENSGWKIDYASIFTEKNEEIEKRIQQEAQKNGKTREEIMETILNILFGNINSLNYLVWVPLNERGDLNAPNVTFQGFTDTLNGYGLRFPDYWEIDNVDSTVFFLAPYSTDGIRPTIAITPNKTPYSQDLESYVDYFLRELPKQKTDITGDIQHVKIQFQNQPAYKVTYKRLRTFDNGRTYITQVIDSLIVFRSGIEYLIEYRNGLAEFEQGKPLADKIINTLKFGPTCSINCLSSMYDSN